MKELPTLRFSWRIQENSSLSTLLWFIHDSMATVGFWELGTPSELKQIEDLRVTFIKCIRLL